MLERCATADTTVMAFRPVFVLAFAASAAGVMAAASPTIELVASDPSSGGTLRVVEPLYVQIRYSSDTPVRFQARGYRHGKEITEGERMNPAPVYPAGTGEAIAWVAYAGAEHVDEVRVIVSDSSWHELAQMTMPIDVAWSEDLPATRDREAWATELNAAQQRMTSAAMNASSEHAGPLWSFLPVLLFASFPGYIWLQVRTWRRWTGGWRIASRLVLGLMVPVLAYTLFALAMGSNLWPLVLIFTMPIAFAYLAALVTARRLFSPES
jgi:hypothetical protein